IRRVCHVGWGKGTWEGQAKVFGTVPVCVGVQEKAYGGEGVLAGKGVKGVLWDNDENSHGINVEGDKLDDEGANEEDEANELYRDVNINLEGQQQSSFVSSRFVLNMLNPSPDTCIDSIFYSTPRVDISFITTVEPPLLSATTLPSPSISIISHV
nr:hypothetical protein [Tanacetum cinerariifolium]